MMSPVTDENIEHWLNMLFGHSEPGDAVHRMMTATADPTGEVTVSVTGIAPQAPEVTGMHPDVFVKRGVKDSIDRAAAGGTILFAALVMEVCAMTDDVSDEVKAEGRRLMVAGNLQLHQQAIEMTQLYAAARDGRRWMAQHRLTGPKAGQIRGPLMFTGPLDAVERGIEQRMIRRAVGL